MKQHFIVTITCRDQPGIVERITEVLVRCSANWEESRFARLGGDFAGIVRISAPQERTPDLTAALQALANDQMSVTVKASHAETQPASEPAALCELKLSGADHEGIVHKVSAYLAARFINVEMMETEVLPAPITATPLFQMHARLKVPAAIALDVLAAELQRIGDELGVDIELTPTV